MGVILGLLVDIVDIVSFIDLLDDYRVVFTSNTAYT